MKKIIRLSLYMAAVIFATSCLKEVGGDDPQQPQEAAREVTLNALALKTAIGDNTDLGKLPIVWEGGDMIAMAFEHSTNGNRAVAELISDIEEGCTEKSSKFNGQIDDEVFRGDYNEVGFAVYPSTAVSEAGEIDFTLPPVQTAREDGSFGKGINLLSTAVNLSQLGTPDYGVTFHNALSFLRFKFTSDVKSVTFEGTSPFTGKAPLKFDMSETGDGRLLIDTDAEWKDEDKNNTFTLKPADGKETFDKGVIYNVLVWPGDHTQLTMTLDVEGYKECVKVSSPTKPIKLEASKFYTITLNDEKLIVTELNNDLDDVDVIGTLGDINGELDEIEKLLSQIQSVSLVSEFVEDAAYARYSLFGSSKMKYDVELNYMVRPASVAEQLVESYSEYMSALLSRRDAEGNLSFATLGVSGVELHGDIMTVKIDADGINGDVYDGTAQGQVALQIAAGGTDILSDFAKLYPTRGAGLDFTRTTDIPVIKGSQVAIPFKFAPNDGDSAYSLGIQVSGNVDTGKAWLKKGAAGTFMGYIYVNLDKIDIDTQSVTVTLDSAGEHVEAELTFAEAGYFNIPDIPAIDYIGADISIDVDYDKSIFNESTYNLQITGNSYAVPVKDADGTYDYYPWLYEATAGVSGYYSVTPNTRLVVSQYNSKNQVVNDSYVVNTGEEERTATAVFNINIKDVGKNGNLAYTIERKITQKKSGTSINENNYYKNGEKVELNKATATNITTPFNIVILGDGYQKRDLFKGGKFEQRAKSAMNNFFGVEPYATFKDRFNVYMVAYESVDAGTDIRNGDILKTDKNTYFDSYCEEGNTAAYVAGTDKVTNAVKSAVESSAEAVYYRSIAILLINTDMDSGSTGYPFRDKKEGFVNGYASFAIAALAADNMYFGRLVRHEAGGHAFGRLADEYYTNGTTATSGIKSNLSEWHSKGFYWNVTATYGTYYMFPPGSGYSGVGFIEGGWGYNYGIYRPTEDGMMQGSTGKFNAPCRHAIYHRIITESEGVEAYAFRKFAQYDQNNL